MEYKELLASAKKSLKKNSPEILAGLGIAGMIFTTVEAVRATPKALAILEDYRYENDLNYDDPIPTKVIVKSCWRCYAPTFILGICSIGSVMGSITVNHKRSVALAAAYSLAEKTLETYKDKVIEELGEDTHRKIEDAVARDEVQRDYERFNQGLGKDNIIDTGTGNYLFKDCMSGQMFRASKEHVDASVNEYNQKVVNDQYCELNEFYDILGIDRADAGHLLGHDVHKPLLNTRYIGDTMWGNEPLTVIKYDAYSLYTCEAYYR